MDIDIINDKQDKQVFLMTSNYDTEYTTQYTPKEMMKYQDDTIHRHHVSLQYPFIDTKSTVADILGSPDHHLYDQKFSSMGLPARKRAALNVFKGK